MRMVISGALLLFLTGTQGRTEVVASAGGPITAHMTMHSSFDGNVSDQGSRHSVHWNVARQSG
jgi:hypothetical protein